MLWALYYLCMCALGTKGRIPPPFFFKGKPFRLLFYTDNNCYLGALAREIFVIF